MRTAEELRYLILAAQREGNRLLAQQLRPLGLTPSQAEVLRVLADLEPLSLNGLGELLVCETGTNPSRLTGRLVAMDLVRRLPGQADRREVELTLTAEGRQLAGQIAAIEESLYELIETAIAGHDVVSLLSLLRRLVAGQPAGQAVARRAAIPAQITPGKPLIRRTT